MNKKVISGVAIITVVVLAVASGFGYYQISELQNQISELQDRNSGLEEQIGELQEQLIERENMIDSARDIKITKFEWTGGYHSLGQVNLFQNFNVTITNMGNNTVSGLTLSVKLFSVESNAKMDEYSTQIDIISAGEIVEIWADVSVGDIRSYAHVAVGVITLTLGDVLLDQQIRNLQGSF